MAAVVLQVAVLKSAWCFGFVRGARIKSEKKKGTLQKCPGTVFSCGNHPGFGKVVCNKAWNEHICWRPASNLYPLTGYV